MLKNWSLKELNLKIYTIQSNSDGNCIILSFGSKFNIALDLGLSGERILNFMIKNNLPKIDYALITHEHIDHVKGAAFFEKRTQIVSHAQTLASIKITGTSINYHKWVRFNRNLKIKLVPTIHAAAAPGAFIIKALGLKIVYLTDTKYVFYRDFKRADYIFIESNYGTELINSYDKIKRHRQTDLDTQDHLSLEEARRILKKMRAHKARYIQLIHMSAPNDELLLRQLAKEFLPAKMTWPTKKLSTH